jgi:hypothetical protein
MTMRVILFQPRFAKLVENGMKRQTIRAKARCKAGDVLSLRQWSGKPYRSKQVILRQLLCRKVRPISIDWNEMRLDGFVLSGIQSDAIARADGFVDFDDMVLWFGITHGVPFTGELISW